MISSGLESITKFDFIERLQVDLPPTPSKFLMKGAMAGHKCIYAFQVLDASTTTRYKVRTKFALKRPKPLDNETLTLYKHKINCIEARMAKTERD